MEHWSEKAIFYHIYPLGLCGAPKFNDPNSESVSRLLKIYPWLEHLAELGCNALYLGPLFESMSHGYDTTNYYEVDHRLGMRQTLTELVSKAHQLRIHVILDAVFNHVGRDFWEFKDVLANRHDSPYRNWFSGLRFDKDNSYHDGFCYDTWDGHENLVKLNLRNPATKTHLLEAVRQWVTDYDIDGLRLDAADVLDASFQIELRQFCSNLKPDFWLMGEVVGGDYRNWVNSKQLHSVTNYECYKGLYSSHNDLNYYEIAWSLNRQFGPDGMYKDLPLYNFADNHDVNRVASSLQTRANLFPLYTLLFTMPGIPSIYYGSEFGVEGVKTQSDEALRPALVLSELMKNPYVPGLYEFIKKLIQIRNNEKVLTTGDYTQLSLSHEQFAFIRSDWTDRIVVVVNSSDQENEINLQVEGSPANTWIDLISEIQIMGQQDGELIVTLTPHSARILRPMD
jgi:cyclomaltodextrinase / maltogenic alpha-amylase / neopullulanase